MALEGTVLSIIALIVVIFIGLKFIKHLIITIVLLAVLLGVLWYTGLFDVSNLLNIAAR